MRQQATAGTLRRLGSLVPLALLAAGVVPAAGSCSGGSSGGALPDDVKAILFLQRMPRSDQGNVFDYTSYSPGARLVKLEPPSADGQLTVLFPTAEHCSAMGLSAGCIDQIDIMSYDLNFNADSIVFSARVPMSDTDLSGQYQLFTMAVDGNAGSLRQLTGDGNDYVYPIYLPGGRILYTTNMVDNVADEGAAQFTDEYERQTTAQVGTISIDGSNQVLGPRNVSHRVAPALLPDGQVVYTEWRHMGMINDGHLRIMNTDMTGMREAFGGETSAGSPTTNSYLKARFVQTTQVPNPDGSGMISNHQMVAIATSRDRTLQSGKLLLLDLNGSEDRSVSRDITPLVPGGEDPSGMGVGRFYDAEPVGQSAPTRFLVSWSDGPVESETLALAGTNAQFGIYVYDMNTRQKFPIYDAPNYWDVFARPLRPRQEPQVASSPISGQNTTIGALNVYDSSLGNIKDNLTPGSVVKVRLIEGFSGEEGGVDMFGTTEFDGQSLYGEIDVKADNSFAAVVPGNVPFHIQLVDKHGLSIANESIWISGRAGEQRFCGGCHENRTKTAALTPGIQQGVLAGAINLVTPRPLRKSATAFSIASGSFANPATQLRGVPWDMAIQPILDAKCASCHNGTASAANPSYTITDNATGLAQTFVFDLRGQKLAVTIGERATGDFTASYLSLMGLGEILSDADVTFTPAPPKQYVEPGSARDSLVIRMLNPMQRFPSVDANVRAFPDRTFDGQQITRGLATHAAAVGGPELTADEYYLLIMNIDMGGQFFFRENLNTAGSATP
jgi:hypothetical protein